MTAKDPIFVSRENQQESDSLAALEAALRPWRLTQVDGRDDIGRDGFFQIHDVIEDGTGRAQATPLTFCIQVRSHAAEFKTEHSETLDTRHLHMWSAKTAPCTLVFVWSRDGRSFRWRSARDLKNEADIIRSGWKDQGHVNLGFRDEHTLNDVKRIRRLVVDESDRDGGVHTFNAARRRIVMTDVIANNTPTGFTIRLSREKMGEADGILYMGPFWQGEDLDVLETDGLSVLASAFFLYEEVWVPLTLVNATLRLLGQTLFRRLVENDRLHVWAMERVGFVHSSDLRSDRNGSLVSLQAADTTNPATVAPMSAELSAWTQRIASEQHVPELGPVILRAVRQMAGGAERAESLIAETSTDLKRPTFRRLLGLTEYSETVPAWDAVLANRLLHLNSAMLMAEQLRADVVEYEGGLSRLASEKFFSRLRLDRLYPTAKALDAVLRTGGLTDVGTLVRAIGRERFFLEVDSSAASEFRDWFWESAGPLVGSGADMRSQFAEAARRVLPVDARFDRVMTRLKLRFFQELDGNTVVGAPLVGPALGGFCARVLNAEELLKRQARNHFVRRQRTIAEFLGRLPDKYDRCPCESGAKYRFCCGKAPN